MNSSRPLRPILRPAIIGSVVAAFILALTAWMVVLSYRLHVRNEQREARSIIRGVEANIEQSLNYARLAALTIVHSLDEDGVPQNFDSLAMRLLDASPYLDAVQLVPGGVIRYTYPLKGHESVIGYDILSDPKVSTEARLAIERREMYFAGPFELKQGGLAVVGRMPVFIGHEFWGFSAVIIRLGRLLETAGIDSTGDNGFYYQFSKLNPNTGEEEFFLPKMDSGNQHTVIGDFTSFPEGEWKFYVYPADPWRTLRATLPVALLGVILAVVAAILVSRTLYRSENRFQTIFEQATDGVFISDPDGRFMLVNPAVCSMTGYTEEEFTTLRFTDLLHGTLSAEHPLTTEPMRHGEPVRKEHVLKRKDGSSFDAEINFKLLAGGEVQGVIRDITERKQARLALQNHAETLERLVQERTGQLTEANLKLAAQHRDLTDSLRYAKRVQEAAFLSNQTLKRIFPFSFALLRPRDEVSGDFFWAHETDRHRMVAVVDCTGHGVPGAMLSMLGLQMLNEIVVEQGITSPAEVLQRMDAIVMQLLHQSSAGGVFDGMDVVLCCQDRRSGQLTFAGAQRPLFLWKDASFKEIPGSKFAIGGHVITGTKHFEEHRFEAGSSDRIYLTSDGFQSQFGGAGGKKFNKRNFRQLLESIACLPMEEQYGHISTALDRWMLAEPQVDDILVVGIRLEV